MFKLDDVVVCVRPRDNLVLNKEYFVEKVLKVQLGDEALVKVQGDDTNYFANRFKLLDPALQEARRKAFEQQKEKEEKQKNMLKVGRLIRLQYPIDDVVGRIFPIAGISWGNPVILGEEGAAIVLKKEQYFTEDTLTIRQLYREARTLGIARRSAMDNAELIEAIKKYPGDRLYPVGKGPLGKRLVAKSNRLGVTCSSYAFAFEDGDELINHYTACHAGFHHIPKRLTCVVESVCNKHAQIKERDEESGKVYRQFVDYMINRSPWKTAFTPCDVDKAIAEGVYVNLDEKYSNVVNALIALRVGHEYNYRLTTWKWLMNKGFDENVAWAASQFLYFDGKIFTLNLPTGAHDWLAPCVTVENYLKFFKDGFQFCQNEPCLRDAINRQYQVTTAINGKPIEYGIGNSVNGRIAKWAIDNLPEKINGKYWDQKKYIPKETVIKFAKLIQEQVQVVK